jgi:AcrR family transcriptional regulator
MREIAAKLGMTTGVVYTYFESKDDILCALADRSRRRSAAMLERFSRTEAAGVAIEELFEMLTEFWPTAEGRRGVRANIALMDEAGRNEGLRATMRELYMNMRKALTTLAERGIEEGLFGSHADPADIGAFLSALFLGLQVETAFLPDTAVAEHLSGVRSVLLGINRRDSVVDHKLGNVPSEEETKDESSS